MSTLDRLEHAKGSPFTFRHRGQVRGLPSPVDMHAAQLLHVIRDAGQNLALDMPQWKSLLLFERWSAHFDLPTITQAERLWYLLDRYSDAIESDLVVYANGADLGALWRARRWRHLLNLIDHLPSHSHYSASVANDVEHAEMIAKAMAEREESGDTPKGPSLTQWTSEVSVLADVVDELRALRHTLVVINSEKGKTPKSPERYPRPQSVMAQAKKRAEHARRLASHKSLAARLLPHKYDSGLQRVGVAETVPPPERKPTSPGTAFLRRKAGLTD